MNKKNKIWIIVSILLAIALFLLSIGAIAKMAYSVGYEDGQQGILKIISVAIENNELIQQIPKEKNSDLIKSIVYIFIK